MDTDVLNALIIKDDAESKKEFEYRKTLTLKIDDAGWSLNTLTCINLARCYVNRKKYKTKYDEGIDIMLDKIDSLLNQ